MLSLRLWSARRARLLEWLYMRFEGFFLRLHPICARIGYQRLEKPVSLVEKSIKGALFDCRMCGRCVLSATGMSCPMNCPKQLRNGPCGGVRNNGNCEIDADMRCVWLEAWEGSQRMQTGERIHRIQFPLDHRLQGSSSWLAIMRGTHEPANPAFVHRYGTQISSSKAVQKAKEEATG